MKMLLFDMDGTLLPMDIDVFTHNYFKLLIKKVAPYGFDSELLYKAVWAGTEAMVKNDGKETNEVVFWNVFNSLTDDFFADHKVFDDFYRNEFKEAKIFCGYNEKIAPFIAELGKRGYRMAVATNPIFPLEAMEERLSWAGLDPNDFETVTCYEKCHYSKPNPEYFKELAQNLKADPEECIMIGNDATEDMAAREAGMQVFLLTDGLLNKDNVDISVYPQGSLDDLLKFIEKNA